MERLRIVGAGTDVGDLMGVQPDNGVVLDALPWLGYRNVQVGFGLFLETWQIGAGGIAPWLDQENSSNLAPRRGRRGQIRPGAVAVSVWERGHPEEPIVSKAFYNLDDVVNIREIEAFLREQGIVLRSEQQQRPALTPAILPRRPLSDGRTLRDLTNHR